MPSFHLERVIKLYRHTSIHIQNAYILWEFIISLLAEERFNCVCLSILKFRYLLSLTNYPALVHSIARSHFWLWFLPWREAGAACCPFLPGCSVAIPHFDITLTSAQGRISSGNWLAILLTNLEFGSSNSWKHLHFLLQADDTMMISYVLFYSFEQDELVIHVQCKLQNKSVRKLCENFCQKYHCVFSRTP